MTKTKPVSPRLQGVLAWNALDNILPELRLGVGIGPPSSNAAASARDWGYGCRGTPAQEDRSESFWDPGIAKDD